MIVRVAAVLAAACLAVGACSNTDPPSSNDATAHMARDIYIEPCPATVWITGTITPESQIRDDNGVVYGLIWGAKNTARVEYGKRYKLGGKWFDEPGGTFWTCAGAEAVIPQ